MNAPLHASHAERRSYSLAPIRQIIDEFNRVIALHRRAWPLDLLPDWLDGLITCRDQAIQLARDGRLKRAAEVCNGSD